jgi:hypothetical protein
MKNQIRLSAASRQVTHALAMLDGAALRELTERLNQVAERRLGVEPEPSEAIERELRILGEVLIATEENIHILQRLQARKARDEWAV